MKKKVYNYIKLAIFQNHKKKKKKKKIEIELDLSNYATKSDLENAASVDISKSDFFLKKSDLANLNLEVNKLDTDKLKKETKQFKQFEK